VDESKWKFGARHSEFSIASIQFAAFAMQD